MDAWLADRRGFDPATWDADQERLARDAVVETAAGHVVRAVRPHVVEAIVRTMFATDPEPALASIDAPVAALVALGSGDNGARLAELRRCGEARGGRGSVADPARGVPGRRPQPDALPPGGGHRRDPGGRARRERPAMRRPHSSVRHR